MPDKNAAAQRVLANAMTLREIGYEVSFIGPTKDINNVITSYCGFNCYYINYPKNIKQWIRYITIFVSTNQILEYKPDYVILYNFPAFASLNILRVCKKNGIKVIHDLTEWESSYGWSLREIIRKIDINFRMHYCMKKMDGIIAISRYLFDYYKCYTKTILIPPTVDLSNEKFNRCRQFTVGTPIQLVYAGTGGGVKDRLDFIISAVSQVQHVKLKVIGLTKEQYELVYGNIPVNCDNVEFKGRLSHQEAVKAVCNADFQMLIRENTLKNKAGFPTKFVESISCCTPIIATVSSNICDYLVDGKNGFIVDNIKSLHRVLENVSKLDADQIILMKENCKNFEGFDYRSFKEEFSKIFN